MGAKSAERVTRINDLELKHQGSVHQMNLTNRDEEARLLKLRLLSLRDENASLKDRMIQKDALVKQLTKRGNEASVELGETKDKVKLQDLRLRKQGNELEALKTEIDSLNDFRQDSNKVLQEKLALSHKLDQLKPELSHLKAQLESHRAVVAQKQDLERQLSSLEVELESEKRSKQRMQSKSHDNDQWKDQLDEAKKELDKMKKEHNRELREARGEYERLEGRVEDTRSKLKKTQTELKDTRAELEACRVELEAARNTALSKKPTKKTVTMAEQPGRKRRVNEMSLDDISIGTPGPDEATHKRQSKKRGAEYALTGEKSTFSITPFLNRTKNMSDELSEPPSPTGKTGEGPRQMMDDGDDEEEAGESVSVEAAVETVIPEEEEVEEAVEAVKEPKAQKPRGRSRKALGDAPTTKKNMPVSAKGKKKATKSSSKLEMVAEEAESASQETQRLDKEAESKRSVDSIFGRTSNTDLLDADGRKKKRKMLGGGNRTIFDDDDVEPAPRPAKIQLAPGRRLKAPLGGVSNALGGTTFSPLKRHRRGVGASFLA
ncbi:hypothetical protein FZEAL_5786 [Fusarium zealandicum]|uniref:Uncharacterized protein n=1 Tax=Fusarium zealandicum TaxID=1053134 RepID=A0A8H4XJG3_9HYPO|nr:hypothetical protein FZEAL_5786 [Fusarium zealandicum]